MSQSQDLPVTFSSFVVSIAQSALMNLGEVSDPESGATARNLPLARNAIELLAMLREKTQGNLDNEEKQLVEAVFGELGQKYEDASR